MDPQPSQPPMPSETPVAASVPQPPASVAGANVLAQQGMRADGMPQVPVFYPANFWQQPWVQNVLPFVTSLSVHLAILIIGLLVFGVYKAVSAPPHQEQVIIPESSMAQEGPPGGVPN